MANKAKWENLDAFRMNQAEIDEIINEATGCSVSWVRPDGHPLSVWVSHAVFDGNLWVTTTNNRPKTRAWRRAPRTSLVFGIAGKGAVTVVGRVEISEDPKLRRRFLEALADKTQMPAEQRDLWFLHMDTDGRITGRIAVEKYITFDERKLVW